MKISKKTIYGFRFLIYLAVAVNKEFTKLNEVAKAEKLSEKYLENIVSILKPYDLIKVKRGAKGGYKLAKAPDEITLKEIYQALDGDILSYEKDNENSAKTINEQVIDEIFITLENKIADYLENKTLQKLVEEYKEKEQINMFYI